LLVSSGHAGTLEVLDTRTAEVVAELSLDGPHPSRLVSKGSIAVVLAARRINEDVYVAGGNLELDVIQLDNPLLPRLAGRWSRIAPFRYTEMQPLSLGRSRFLVLGDPEVNSILLLRLPQASVLQALGLPHGMGFGTPFGKGMATAGPFLAVAGHEHYALFRLSRNRLALVAEPALETGERVLGLVVRSDGLVAVSTSRAVVVRGTDGRETRLVRGREVSWAEMTLVRGGSQALDVVRDDVGPGGITLFDLDNVSGPRVLWNGWGDAIHASPSADGTRLLVVLDYPVRLQLVDLGTGIAVSDPSGGLPVSYYPEVALAFGAEAGARALVQGDAHDGFHTLLMDVSGTVPVLLSTGEAWPDRSMCLPRASGAGWVEFRPPFFGGGHDGSVRLMDADGTVADVTPPFPWYGGWHATTPLGHGTYAATEWRLDNKVELVTWTER